MADLERFLALLAALRESIAVLDRYRVERALGVPSTYREIFRVLTDGGVLDADLGRRMAAWAGLRNLIAHAYGSLDVERLAAALYDEFDDLGAFAAAMARLVSDPAADST